MNYWPIALVLSFTFILTANFVLGDVIPEGKKGVYYCFMLSNTNEYPDYTFIAYFTLMGGHKIIEQGDCIGFYKFSNVEIYAIKKSDFNESDINNSQGYFKTNEKLIPSSEIKMNKINTVDEDNPLKGVTDVFEIVALTENSLEIRNEKVIYKYGDGTSEEKYYGADDATPAPSGWPLSPLWCVVPPILAAVCIVVILLSRRHRRTTIKG